MFGLLRVPADHPPTEILAPSASCSLPRSGSRKTISRRSASHRIASSLQTKVSGPPRRSSSVVHRSPILSTPGPAASSSPGPSFTTARGPQPAAKLGEGRHRTPMATRQDRASRARMGRASTRSVLSSIVMATCTFTTNESRFEHKHVQQPSVTDLSGSTQTRLPCTDQCPAQRLALPVCDHRRSAVHLPRASIATSTTPSAVLASDTRRTCATP